jgi:hypothetical protein
MDFIRKISVLSMLVLVVVGAKAQNSKLSFEVRGGINLANVDAESIDTDLKVGYRVGLIGQYELPQSFFLQTGLELSSKGFKYEDSFYDPSNGYASMDQSTNAVYLQLPIMLGYNEKLNKNVSLNFTLGTYLAYGIGGKTKVSGSYLYNQKVNTFSSETLKHFDMGLVAGVGVEYNQFTFNAGYEYGLVNFSRSDIDILNRNWFLTVGYKFF